MIIKSDTCKTTQAIYKVEYAYQLAKALSLLVNAECLQILFGRISFSRIYTDHSLYVNGFFLQTNCNSTNLVSTFCVTITF